MTRVSLQSRYLSGGVEEYYENRQLGEPASGPKFEYRPSRIQNTSATHLTVTTGRIIFWKGSFIDIITKSCHLILSPGKSSRFLHNEFLLRQFPNTFLYLGPVPTRTSFILKNERQWYTMGWTCPIQNEHILWTDCMKHLLHKIDPSESAKYPTTSLNTYYV